MQDLMNIMIKIAKLDAYSLIRVEKTIKGNVCPFSLSQQRGSPHPGVSQTVPARISAKLTPAKIGLSAGIFP
jgi:hypothetical protein